VTREADDAKIRKRAYKEGMKPPRVSGRDEGRSRAYDGRRNRQGRGARLETHACVALQGVWTGTLGVSGV
jgi:hypothetical protein